MINRLKSFCKSKDFVDGVKNCLVIFAYLIIAISLMSNFTFAADDDSSSDEDIDGIEETVSHGMEKIQGLMFKFSTGAVVIAVGCGVFIKKFSMGKQDKIELGNKLIRDSLIGFVVLNAMPIIASTIQNFLSSEGGATVVGEESSIIGQYFKNFI